MMTGNRKLLDLEQVPRKTWAQVIAVDRGAFLSRE